MPMSICPILFELIHYQAATRWSVLYSSFDVPLRLPFRPIHWYLCVEFIFNEWRHSHIRFEPWGIVTEKNIYIQKRHKHFSHTALTYWSFYAFNVSVLFLLPNLVFYCLMLMFVITLSLVVFLAIFDRT